MSTAEKRSAEEVPEVLKKAKTAEDKEENIEEEEDDLDEEGEEGEEGEDEGVKLQSINNKHVWFKALVDVLTNLAGRRRRRGRG